MDFYKKPYQATIETVEFSPSEEIWKKFEYFDKNTEEFNDQYDDIKGKLLDLWFEQFQKEYNRALGPISKKGGKK